MDFEMLGGSITNDYNEGAPDRPQIVRLLRCCKAGHRPALFVSDHVLEDQLFVECSL